MYNILICDDEQDIVNALKIYLSGGDYCLFEAHNLSLIHISEPTRPY